MENKKDKTIEYSEFGRRLKKAFRNARNTKIADESKLSRSAITKYLRYRYPEADELIRLAEARHKSIHWLLTGKGPEDEVNLLDLQAKIEGDENLSKALEAYRYILELPPHILDGLLVILENLGKTLEIGDLENMVEEELGRASVREKSATSVNNKDKKQSES